MSSLTQKQVVILLSIIAALLAGVIGIMYYDRQNSVPDVDPSKAASAQDAQQQTSGDGMPGAGGTAAPADFDPASAPKVPEGQTPEEYVNQYYSLCEAGEYSKAFDMLPGATKQYYQSVEGFEAALQSYQIGGYKVEPQQESGDQMTVLGYQTTPQMDIGYTWVFVKGDDGWLLQARNMN